MKLPLFFEDSKIPVILSKIGPIEIGAISLGIAVFSRGKMSDTTRRHETIHYRQWLELGFIGFLILYPLLWLIDVASGMSGYDAYRLSPFEKEAYNNQDDVTYFEKRKLFAWMRNL